jgi:RNA polymerase sigma-70 factor (ECF subfamily)
VRPKDLIPEPADALFTRWCRRGDARALGELFDELAPRLLRLAIHLVGDPAEAEDLVQATFLTAIERRREVDASRPVLPWLTGVLAHKARQYRRRAARSPDPERLSQAEVEDPSGPLERRELDGEVARAIDGLEEPYRRVVLLRLRHGMAPADIAHVLERDPGTVRVQLHRGLERLRQVLPAALASSLVLGTWTPRGLAAVKTAVLEGAAVSAASVPPALGIGSLLMGKKLGLAAACLAVVATVAWNRSRAPGRPAAAEPVTAEPGSGTGMLAADPDSPGTDEAQARSFSAQREAVTTSMVVPNLRGRVVDADSGEPVPGARVALYAPHRVGAFELQRDHPELFQVGLGGELEPRGHGDWPRVVGTVAAIAGEPLACFDQPHPGESALEETRTDGTGGFDLALEEDGLLEVSSEGYLMRWRPVQAETHDLVIELGRGHEVTGRVLGPGAEPVADLELVLTGMRLPSASTTSEPEPGSEGPRLLAAPFLGEQRGETFGVWRVRTGADGRFRARVTGLNLFADVLSPGWVIPMAQVYSVQLSNLSIHVERSPGFHFVDAQDGSPIERVRLLGVELSNRYVRWAGEYHAPGGHLDLPGPSFLIREKGTVSFVAWSPGYLAARLSIPDLASAGTLEVPMERGEIPTLRGTITRAGRPVAGAEVALLGHSPLQWTVDEEYLVDAARSDARGGFALSAPRGSYLVRVRTAEEPFLEKVTFADRPGSWMMRAIEGREPLMQLVELPAERPLAIELTATSTLEVEVVDADGTPHDEHVVALRGTDGRQLVRHTGPDGLLRFGNLPAGAYQLHTPHVTTLGSFAGGELRDVELAPGRVEHVRIELPIHDGPRHLRVSCRDVLSYEEWRARYDGDEWQPLEVDGTVPMDLTTDRFTLHVAAPDGRRWHLEIPKEASDGRVVELEAGSGRYRGVLRHPDGKPWSEVAVHAVPWGSGGPDVRVSTVTDLRGEFELPGLGAGPYRLRFQTQLERNPWDEWDNALAGVWFEPVRAPDEDGPWLDIRAASTSEAVRLSGRVEDAQGLPLAGALLFFERELPGLDGCLRLGGRDHNVTADDQGAFVLDLPRAPRLRVRAFDQTRRPPVLVLERTLEPAELQQPLRLVAR